MEIYKAPAAEINSTSGYVLLIGFLQVLQRPFSIRKEKIGIFSVQLKVLKQFGQWDLSLEVTH